MKRRRKHRLSLRNGWRWTVLPGPDRSPRRLPGKHLLPALYHLGPRRLQSLRPRMRLRMRRSERQMKRTMYPLHHLVSRVCLCLPAPSPSLRSRTRMRRVMRRLRHLRPYAGRPCPLPQLKRRRRRNRRKKRKEKAFHHPHRAGSQACPFLSRCLLVGCPQDPSRPSCLRLVRLRFYPTLMCTY